MIPGKFAVVIIAFELLFVGYTFAAASDTTSLTPEGAKLKARASQIVLPKGSASVKAAPGKNVSAKTMRTHRARKKFPEKKEERKSQSVDTALLAPELDGGVSWLNTDKPIHIKDLRGKVVLLDFWTYCCINCMHVIPDLKKLEAKYASELVVIGVHSAKFDNERESANIQKAISRYGIEHPVVNDAKLAIWNNYGVNSWPTLVVIDPSGHIYGQAAGEGNFAALDSAIASIVASFDKNGLLDRKPLVFAARAKVANESLSFPGKITADAASQRLFISDSGHNRILITAADGKILDVIGSGKEGADDGDFTQASFHHPQGLAVGNLARLQFPASGNVSSANPANNNRAVSVPFLGNSSEANDYLYVADTENHLIRLVNLKTKMVSTLAGTRQQAFYPPSGGDATVANLNSPWDLVLVGHKLYIAMAGCHQIWLYDFDKDAVEPYAGNTVEGLIDGPLKLAALAQPSGITSDGKKLYFVDSEASAVRSADLQPSGNVETIVGQGLFVFGDQDGIGTKARLQHPLGITFFDGKLYIADSYNHKIKTIDINNKSVKTLVGNGKPGFENGILATFSEPGGLCALGDTLYIADTNNNAIRRLDPKNGIVDSLEIKATPLPDR
jgi:thiol-disulfide isomerase/thioredoxin